jgi:hypothetical protein|tara:strand:+ start:2080 stop:3354 length:1275 start_codon:yes stop_codon:yes gene_type:complete
VVDIILDDRLTSLKEQFPDTPDTIILKADVLREGISFSAEMAEAGSWSIPGGAFLSRENIPERESYGADARPPNQMILDDDTRINTELDHASPYAIRGNRDSGYTLCRHDEPVTPLSFTPRPEFSGELYDGSSIASALGQRAEHCAAIVHTVFCEYGRDGDECAYCFLGNVQTPKIIKSGRRLRGTNHRRTIEACAAASRQIRLDHVVVSGGALVDTTLEVKSYVKTVSALRAAVGPDTRITAVCQAFDQVGWRALQEAGVSRVQPNLEVWDEDLWAKIIPGKAKAIGKELWIERLKQAIDVFGVGEVATSFVAGIECCDPSTNYTEVKALAAHGEAYESLLNDEIVPMFGLLTKARGTRYENVELPATEFFLQLGWNRTQMMQQSGMFDRYTSGVDADFSCYKCVTHKTCQDYPRLMELSGNT